jgi:hypothetical protein
MATIAIYVVSLIVVVATVAAAPVRRALERRADAIKDHPDLVDSYQASAARFLRATDPETHGILRSMLVWVGDEMLKGTRLIDGVLYARMARKNGNAKRGHLGDAEYDSLPDEARHDLARALGAALSLSAGQSLFARSRYQALVDLIVSAAGGEVKEPKQVVHRLEHSNPMATSNHQAA